MHDGDARMHERVRACTNGCAHAELQRVRSEYEEDFAQERALLRALRQRRLDRILDDNVRCDDALRYVFGAMRAARDQGAG